MAVNRKRETVLKEVDSLESFEGETLGISSLEYKVI